MQYSKWQDWAAVGMLLAILGAIVSTAAGWWTEIYGFLLSWQTLATGILAIIAARWTVREMQEGRKVSLAQQAKKESAQLLSDQSKWHKWRGEHVANMLDVLFPTDETVPYQEVARSQLDRLKNATNKAFEVLTDPEWRAMQERIGVDGDQFMEAVFNLNRDQLEARKCLGEVLTEASYKHPISNDTVIDINHPSVQRFKDAMNSLYNEVRKHIEHIGATSAN